LPCLYSWLLQRSSQKPCIIFSPRGSNPWISSSIPMLCSLGLCRAPTMKWADFSRHCRRSRPCSTEQKATDSRLHKPTLKRLRHVDSFEVANVECEPPSRLLAPYMLSSLVTVGRIKITSVQSVSLWAYVSALRESLRLFAAWKIQKICLELGRSFCTIRVKGHGLNLRFPRLDYSVIDDGD
jgi:hypothetical protein